MKWWGRVCALYYTRPGQGRGRGKGAFARLNMAKLMQFETAPRGERVRAGKLFASLGCIALIATASGCVTQKPDSPVNIAEAGNGAVGFGNSVKFDSASGKYLAGRFARHTRDYKAAAVFLSDVLDKDGENRLVRRQVLFSLAAAGKMDEALALSEKILKFDKASPVPNLIKTIAQIRDGKFSEVAKRLKSTPRRGMNTFTVPLLTAWIHAASQDFEAAHEALKPLEKISAFAGIRHLHSALLFDLADDNEKAEQSYKAALEAANSLPVVLAYGQFLERVNRGDDARAVYEKFSDDGEPSVSIEAAYARIDRGEKPLAMISSPRDGIAEVLFNMAGTLGRSRSVDLALIYGQLALWLKPDFPLARILMGDLLEVLERPEDSLAMFKGVDKTSPHSWTARLRQTSILNSLKRNDEAVEILEQMAAEKPARSDAIIRLGDLLRSEKRFEEAAEAYTRAIKRAGDLKTGDWSLLYSRGIAYERSDQWPKAEKDFLRALELSPKQPFVLNYLGYSWVDQGLNLERAKEMIEEAVRLRPRDGYIVDSLGWVLYRLGDYRGAVLQLERAVVLRPQDPTINDHLGDAYWRVGRRMEARFQWRRALSLDPEKDQIPVIEKKLNRGLADLPGKDRRG